MNITTRLRNQTGFTIVEVVLVLAIAGLIFLIVFLALPQLQKSRRDTQRRSDVGRVLAQLEQYSANNNGNYPAESCSTTATQFGGFLTTYFEAGEINDPSTGNTYSCATGTGGTTPADNTLYYDLSGVCSGTSSGRSAAVRVKLESGGVYCQDNT